MTFLVPAVNSSMTEKDSTATSKPKGKPGPKPKQLQPKTVMALPVGKDNTLVPPEEVFKLASIGCKNIEIAQWFQVSEEAISRHFKTELERGRAQVKISLRRAMLDNACKHMNAVVQIFLAKNMLGMTSEPLASEAHQPLPWSDNKLE